MADNRAGPRYVLGQRSFFGPFAFCFTAKLRVPEWLSVPLSRNAAQFGRSPGFKGGRAATHRSGSSYATFGAKSDAATPRGITRGDTGSSRFNPTETPGQRR